MLQNWLLSNVVHRLLLVGSVCLLLVACALSLAKEGSSCTQSSTLAERAKCDFDIASKRIRDKEFVSSERGLVESADKNFRDGNFSKAWSDYWKAGANIPAPYVSIMQGTSRFMGVAQGYREKDIDGKPTAKQCYAAAEFVRLVEIEVPQTFRVGLEQAKLYDGGRPVTKDFLDIAASRASCLERLAKKMVIERVECTDFSMIQACMVSR